MKVLPANMVNVVKTYGEREGKHPLTGDLAVDATEWSALRPGRYTHWLQGWAGLTTGHRLLHSPSLY